MPLDSPVSARVQALNRRYRHHGATAVIEHALRDKDTGKVALVSSFGAESVVLLHLASVIDRALPILFIDTAMLFPETLAYQQELAEKLRLSDIRVIRADAGTVAQIDPDGTLNRHDQDACCALRKTEPLQNALAGFDAWITGRKRYQGGQRSALEFFENEADRRIKIDPLAHWSSADLHDYMVENRLPRHPLIAKGYPSIGCAPCTSKVAAGEDERAGRWRGSEKEECGIHFVNGKMVRIPVTAKANSIDDIKLDGTKTDNSNTGLPRQETNMNVIVSDSGFAADDWTGGFDAPQALDLAPDANPADYAAQLAGAKIIRIAFPSFSDGRGFTIGKTLRDMGFVGRLRAYGHVLADQYAMARRAGFDEVEISADLAARQPEPQWLARADWQQNNYQARLRA
ncbi:MAG: phosphoadenylyl-sulfate reductase [Rhodobacteraceae bacterium]|nr:phosphoadenylyl-sulfate reductase [Paracoccaceae bacterium]